MSAERPHGMRQSLSDTIFSLRVALKAAYKLAPLAVILLAVLAILVVWLTTLWSPLMTASTVLLVMLVSLMIFTFRGDFGEALLSLVGGLFAVFANEWTTDRYLTFSVAWVGFVLIAILISSVKIAGQLQDIYQQTAFRLVGAGESFNEMAALLEKIGRQTSAMPMLSPIQRAEIIRLFAFRGMPPTLFRSGIQATEALSVITKCDVDTVAVFVSDFFQSFQPNDEEQANKVADLLHLYIRMTPVSPEEFFVAFEKSRRLIVSRLIPPETFLDELREGLSVGVAVDEIADHIQKKCAG